MLFACSRRSDPSTMEGVSDEDPAWAWWIDERELAWHEAMVQRDLGMPERAIAQFERSVIATPPTEIRSQYLHRAYLLQAQVDNATWDDAEQINPTAAAAFDRSRVNAYSSPAEKAN